MALPDITFSPEVPIFFRIVLKLDIFLLDARLLTLLKIEKNSKENNIIWIFLTFKDFENWWKFVKQIDFTFWWNPASLVIK